MSNAGSLNGIFEIQEVNCFRSTEQAIFALVKTEVGFTGGAERIFQVVDKALTEGLAAK